MMSLDKFVVRQKRQHSDENHDVHRKKSPKLCAASEKLELETARSFDLRKIRDENLDLDYGRLFPKNEADAILKELEDTVIYNTDQLSKIMIFGKRINIPRKQAAYGEEGLSYTFSGNTVPAQPWIPSLTRIRDVISKVTGYSFNFVLINRYKDGDDYIGEHKDDEKDLSEGFPIASLSLGQSRDFYFKHQDSRGKGAARKISPVKLVLNHGDLLLMNAPTNQFWYHALPRRRRLTGVRVNLTFRKMNSAVCRPIKKKTIH